MNREESTKKDSGKREIAKNPANQKSGNKPGAPKKNKEENKKK